MSILLQRKQLKIKCPFSEPDERDGDHRRDQLHMTNQMGNPERQDDLCAAHFDP